MTEVPIYTSTTSTTGGDLVWPSWAATTTSTSNIWGQWATTATSSNAVTWINWASTESTTATTITTAAWNAWNSQDVQRAVRQVVRTPVDPAVEEAARVQRAAQAEQWRVREEERKRVQALADEKAMTLLRAALNEQQNQDLATKGHFFVDAPSGRRYRVDKGRSGNLKVINKQTGVWEESLCVHQQMNVPIGDTMLIQKLLIETAEDVLRSYANITRRAGGFVHGKSGLLKAGELDNIIELKDRTQQRVALRQAS